MTSGTKDNQNPQQSHYEAIHDDYEAHYYDASSMDYRHQFLYGPLFKDLSLDNSSVADLACGSGYNSLALRTYYPNVRTTGYDISRSACRDYRSKLPDSRAYQLDLTVPNESQIIHDAAVVIGGLHHCVSDLDETLRNVARMVRPGGLFMMMEPNNDFLLSSVRRIWYRKDKWFEADSEEALKHDEILTRADPYFVCERLRYFGGPAFYLILNSLIMRVPTWAKPALSRLLFPIERLYHLLPGKSPHAAFLAVWRRTETPVSEGRP